MTDTIAEIRARHEAASAPNAEMTETNWRLKYGASAHADRAVLLPIAERCLAAEARVAELEARNAQQREVLYLYAVQYGTVTQT